MPLVRRNKCIAFLFECTFAFSCIAYLGYFIYTETHGLRPLIGYSSIPSIARFVPFYARILQYAKDFFAVSLLFVGILCVNRKSQLQTIYIFILVALYGTLIALINGYGIATAFAGYRMLVYLLALVLLFFSSESNIVSLKRFIKLATVLLIANMATACLQAFQSLGPRIYLVGQGSYRFMGLFAAGATVANFAIGMALFSFVLPYKVQNISVHRRVTIYITSVILCYISGTRSALINVLFIVYIEVMKNSKLKQRQKILVTGVIGIFVLFAIINFASISANRGSILENNLDGGRLGILLEMLFDQDGWHMLFGHGIGAGSNAAVLLGAVNATGTNARVLDGTFNTMIYQFGISGFFVVVSVIIYTFNKIKKNRGFLPAIAFGFTLGLQCLTSNVLEVFTLLILLFASYDILLGKTFSLCE